MDTRTPEQLTDTCKVILSDRLAHLHVHPQMILTTHITFPSHSENEGFPSEVSSDPARRSPSHHPHPSCRITTMKTR